jgi:hypothetical protein
MPTKPAVVTILPLAEHISLDLTHIATTDSVRPSRAAIDWMDLLAITSPHLYPLIRGSTPAADAQPLAKRAPTERLPALICGRPNAAEIISAKSETAPLTHDTLTK